MIAHGLSFFRRIEERASVGRMKEMVKAHGLEQFGVSHDTSQRDLRELIKPLGLLKKVGKGHEPRYEKAEA